MLGIDQIARLAAEEARREQNRADGSAFGGRKAPLLSGAKEKVSITRALATCSFCEGINF